MSDYIAPLVGPAGTGGSGGTLAITAALTRTATGSAAPVAMVNPFDYDVLAAGDIISVSGTPPVYLTDQKALRLTDDGTGTGSIFALNPAHSYSLLDVSLDMTLTADTANLRLQGFFIQTGPGFTGYRIIHYSDTSNNYIQVTPFINGVGGSGNNSNYPSAYNLNQKYTMRARIDFTTGHIVVWLDGVKFNDFTDSSHPQWTSGVAGAYTYGATSIFDNLTLTAPAATVTGLPAGALVRTRSAVSSATAGTAVIALPAAGRVDLYDSTGVALRSAYMAAGDTWAYA